jgi:ribosomal protein S18 acetylase RimI-like enzyme
VAYAYDSDLKKNVIMGTLGLKSISDKYRKEFNAGFDQKIAFIDKVGVGSRSRRKGVGHHLMQEAIKFAKSHGYEYLALNVLEIATPAINLYKKCGMKTVYHKEKLALVGMSKTGMIMKL